MCCSTNIDRGEGDQDTHHRAQPGRDEVPHAGLLARLHQVAQAVARDVADQRQDQRPRGRASPEPTTADRKYLRLRAASAPSSGAGADWPRPRNDSAASVRISVPRSRLAVTSALRHRARQQVAAGEPDPAHAGQSRGLDVRPGGESGHLAAHESARRTATRRSTPRSGCARSRGRARRPRRSPARARAVTGTRR